MSITIHTTLTSNNDWLTDLGEGALQGYVTTDHPASSYGLPVFVSAGVAYGSAEVGPLYMVNDDEQPTTMEGMIAEQERMLALRASLVAAGYTLAQ